MKKTSGKYTFCLHLPDVYSIIIQGNFHGMFLENRRGSKSLEF